MGWPRNFVVGFCLSAAPCCKRSSAPSRLCLAVQGNNAMLCGRISMLLAWLLPIWDKSGANMRGEVNMSNPLVIEDVQEGAVDSNGAPIDVQFYRTFWGLQKYFQVCQAALLQPLSCPNEMKLLVLAKSNAAHNHTRLVHKLSSCGRTT